MPLVSIIILNYNGRVFLNKCLELVFNSTFKDFEVILVDNASNDGSADSAHKKFSHYRNFRLIKNRRNYGYAKGNNIGVSHSSSDSTYIVFLNPDTSVDPHWLEPMLKYMEDEKVAVTQPKIMMLNDNEKIDSMGHCIDMLTFTVQIGHGEHNKGQYDKAKKIFSATGSAMMIKKDVFLKLRGFDEDFFMYFEESDFCWRVWLLGYQVLCVPCAIVYHYGGGLTKGTDIFDKQLYYTLRNKYYSMIKNLELRSLMVWLPISLFLRFFLLFFTSNKALYIISYLKAALDMFIRLRLPIRKRKELIRKRRDIDLLKQGVIKPFSIHYLLAKKAF